MAFGPLQLKPHEFWDLLPGELDEMAEGYHARRREAWLRTVWAVVTVCNATGRLRRPLRVDRIMRQLGFHDEETRPDPDAGLSAAERLRRLRRDVEGGRAGGPGETKIVRGRGSARRREEGGQKP